MRARALAAGLLAAATMTGGAAAAPGTEQVGFHGFAVTVPGAVQREAGDCAPPNRDAVYYYPTQAAGPLCPIGTDTSHTVTTVGIGPLSKAPTKLTGRLRPAGDVDGHAVRASDLECGDVVCTQLFAVPDGNVFFALQTKGPDREHAAQAVRSSLTAVAAGQVAVPFSPYATVAARRDAATRAGLSVRVHKRYFPLTHAGHLVSETPPVGAVVARGSRLALVVPGASYPPTTGGRARRARLIAQYVADDEASMIPEPRSDLTAFYRIHRGRVLQPNLGYRCTSGRLLHVTVSGDFGVVHGRAGRDAGSAILMEIDPDTGNVCLLGVSTERREPGPHDTVIPVHGGGPRNRGGAGRATTIGR